jgi:hypothetical protein
MKGAIASAIGSLLYIHKYAADALELEQLLNAKRYLDRVYNKVDANTRRLIDNA